MTEEAAKQLAEAMNRLAAAIERATAGGMGGLHVHHHGIPYPVAPLYPQQPGYFPIGPVWSGVGNITGGNS